jgi:hypothetical protein
MGINLGSLTPTNFRLGNTQVNSIWLGNTKVWPEITITEDFLIGGASCYNVGDIQPSTAISTYVTGSDIYFNLMPSRSLIAGAFANCTSLTSASFPNVKSLGVTAFQGCTSLVSASLPNVTEVGVEAFKGCSSLIKISLPNVTGFGSTGTFIQCTSLISASLDNISAIGNSYFSGCSSLTHINLPGLSGASVVGIGAFDDVPNAGTIIIPLLYSSSFTFNFTYLRTPPRNWTFVYV